MRPEELLRGVVNVMQREVEQVHHGVQHGAQQLQHGVQYWGKQAQRGMQHWGEQAQHGVQHWSEQAQHGMQHWGRQAQGAMQYWSEQAQGLVAVVLQLPTSVVEVAKSVSEERPGVRVPPARDGTVTIFLSDIEGSTALNEHLGDPAWMTLLGEHDGIIRRQQALHHGEEVKTRGDGFMLAFQSALDGVRCAIDVQRAIAQRNATTDPTIRVRIGLHVGVFVRHENDFYGYHVNFAARVADKAKGGEILVSSVLWNLVKPAREFRFDAPRTRKLKGVHGTHTLYPVRWA
jgi:adenylate cyclase